MLRKYYTANIVLGGSIIGYTTCRLWFFQSPWKADDVMTQAAEALNSNASICDIRRLK